MKHIRRRLCLVGLSVVCSAALLAAPVDVDSAFKAFWGARNPQEAAKAIPDVIKTGTTFGDVLKRLRDGRPYSPAVQKGVIKKNTAARMKSRLSKKVSTK